MHINSHIGTILGLGILGAALSVTAAWMIGGGFWAMAGAYVLGGMFHTVLAASALACRPFHAEKRNAPSPFGARNACATDAQ